MDLDVAPHDAGLDRRLDNPVWHALTGRHARFRQGDGGAARYQPEVSVFGALPDEPSGDDWRELAALVGAGGVATLMRDVVVEPPGWSRVMTVDVRQMVAAEVEGRLDPEVVVLGPADVDDMVELVAATEPGPFDRRTVELGGYVGLRERGRLVAMAGHRLALPGLVEISAVCTDSRERGRGLASRLVRHVVARAAHEGDATFLHAAASNAGAIRLYEQLGFVHRRRVEAVGLVPDPAADLVTAPLCR